MTSLTADGQAGSESGTAVDDGRGQMADRVIGRLGVAPCPVLATNDAQLARFAEFPALKGIASGRVPHHAFVTIAVRDARPATILTTANDNTRAGAPRARSVWRDLFFLAILAMTIIGAFWSGKLNATQRVIVVPGPSSDRHMVT